MEFAALRSCGFSLAWRVVSDGEEVLAVFGWGLIFSGGLVKRSWAELGSAGTQIPQPFQISTDGGFKFTVYKNNSPTAYIRADEGNGFVGDFLPNEPLLFSTSLTAIDIKFTTPIVGIVRQFQRGKHCDEQPFDRGSGTSIAGSGAGVCGVRLLRPAQASWAFC